jgi:hypothetical protein
MERGALIFSPLQLKAVASNWSVNPASVEVLPQFAGMAVSQRSTSWTDRSAVQLPLVPEKLRPESLNHGGQCPGVQPRSAARHRQTQRSPKVRKSEQSKVGCSQPQLTANFQEFALVSSKMPKRAVFCTTRCRKHFVLSLAKVNLKSLPVMSLQVNQLTLLNCKEHPSLRIKQLVSSKSVDNRQVSSSHPTLYSFPSDPGRILDATLWSKFAHT